jgi:hypothetical protein
MAAFVEKMFAMGIFERRWSSDEHVRPTSVFRRSRQ